MEIDLGQLQYTFHTKPLLIGGKAMEYYGLRQAGADIDFVIAREDYQALVRRYPHNTTDLFGDLGIHMHNFELWTSIMLFDYNFLAMYAISEAQFKVIALDKLLFLKTLVIGEPKYVEDTRLIVTKIHAIQYGKDAVYPSDFFTGAMRGLNPDVSSRTCH